MKRYCVFMNDAPRALLGAMALLLTAALLLTGCPPTPPGNNAPIAVDDDFTVDQNSIDNLFDVLANDSTGPDVGESLSITAVGDPDQGGAVAIDTNQLRYSPLQDFVGTETFTYTIEDGSGGFATATVTVTVEFWAESTTTFDVTWAPETLLVEAADLDLVLQSDVENHTYTFDSTGLTARGIQIAEGDVLVLHGMDVCRVSSLSEGGGELQVVGESVALNEAITDGVMAWDYGVEFNPDQVKSISVAGERFSVPKDGSPIDFSVTIGDFTYHVEATLDGASSDFVFTVKKDIGGNAGVELVARGMLERFRSQNRYVFSGGQLQEAEQGTNGLRGEATLELVVAGSAEDYELLNLPATVFSVPFIVGSVPFTLDIKIRFIIRLIVPVDGSSRVTVGFSYDSDLGFEYKGTQVTAGGGLGGHDFEEGVHETGASSHIAAIFGIGFPRVELTAAGGLASGWAQMAFQLGGSYGLQPPCQTADATLLGSVGYNLSAYGVFGLSGSKTLFQVDRPLLRTGDCPPDKAWMETWGVFDTVDSAPLADTTGVAFN